MPTFKTVELQFLRLTRGCVSSLQALDRLLVPAFDHERIPRANLPDARPWRDEPTNLRRITNFKETRDHLCSARIAASESPFLKDIQAPEMTAAVIRESKAAATMVIRPP